MAPLHIPGSTDRFSALTAAAQEQTNAPTMDLAGNLERDLETPVRLEHTEDWSNQTLRRMERDIIVLQIGGTDRWSIYGREAQAALDPSLVTLVGSGSVLYVPRGYWCAASPQTTPSSNLIFRIENPTGADLLAWFASLLKEYEAFQTDIPRFASPARQAAYLTTLRKATARAYRAPSLLEAFARRRNNFASRHASTGSVELSDDRWVSLAAPRYPKIRRLDPQTICLRHDGREIHFPVDAAPLLQYLFDKMPIAVRDFYRDFESDFDRANSPTFCRLSQRTASSRSGCLGTSADMGEIQTKAGSLSTSTSMPSPPVSPKRKCAGSRLLLTPLAEAIFGQTVDKLRAAIPPPMEIDTRLDAMIRMSSRTSACARMDYYMFHVSHTASRFIGQRS